MSNKFVFVVPCWNASKTLARCLHSVACQSYTNWRVILIDDVSDIKDVAKEMVIVDLFNHILRASSIQDVWEKKVELFDNTEKKWEVANVLHGVSMCEDEDVVCRLDADDCLCDSDALFALNMAYEQGYDAVWTAHRWTGSGRNISGPLDNDDPYQASWTSSHLKSWRKKLLNNVPYENFLNQNRELVRRAGDRAVYLPVLRNAKKRGYMPMVTYSYTIDEQGGAVYKTSDARFQKEEADFISQRGFVSEGKSWEEVMGYQNP